jgi:hypothetical protein
LPAKLLIASVLNVFEQMASSTATTIGLFQQIQPIQTGYKGERVSTADRLGRQTRRFPQADRQV